MKTSYKTTVELDRASINAFRELYPQRGAMKTFFNTCLEKFLEIHNHDYDREISETVGATLEEMQEED